MLEEKHYPPRTDLQNKALHVLFNMLARELNDAGLDMRKTLKPGIDIPWNPKTVKDFLWRPVMKAQLGILSTTELNTKNIDEVFETLARHLGQKFGIELDFPSIQTLMLKDLKEYGSKKLHN